MFIKKIFQSLPSNLIFFIITLLSFIPIITIYYVIKFYLFTVKLSIHQLKQGIVVQFYQHLTTQQSNHHVEFH
ncbi:hypothetical protein RS022_06590 [Candidatus Phytoplasma rubi]|uniref:Secreted protein n=1 Tax=Candidatus Phytoplasma rubi TaxID=399025 RepID=A0ABY7BQR5_9MOLU|nr:hypothetical protein [Candidatus Phytoplasma rubi]WAN63031.1 hypothetical protein RS022_00180 [Candidatus Phytoplasma rubi]WAN63105.1 hypothetical protein RS022_01020 [Candidatus Phytoplasma rubi]WAN63493.1 hypothetical protein RS022_06590 [Candidatus Phytoplasma rubi]